MLRSPLADLAVALGLVAGGVPPIWHPAVSVSVAVPTLGVVGAIRCAFLVRMLAESRPDMLDTVRHREAWHDIP